ncbi:MAG: PASTA domain-containing protein [Dysgonamonadaceae bacterium]|jgi:beta-lactam-binding protein with PASTA domain|nr:PASTA domain-containing protein [Dysgonamonadaceae bacterium]
MSILNFFKKHILLANVLLALFIVIALVYILLLWLDTYTNHGKAVDVPDVKGLQVEDAASFFQTNDLYYTVIDSQFVKNALPGAILETIPPVGTPVKKGRTIYLTINSFSAKLLTVPDVIDMSQRQALSMLKSLGFESVREKVVPGAFRELVVGLEIRGKTLTAGDKIPADTPLTLLISSGTEKFISEEENETEIPEEETWY